MDIRRIVAIEPLLLLLGPMLPPAALRQRCGRR
jgi:hypothetical protein